MSVKCVQSARSMVMLITEGNSLSISKNPVHIDYTLQALVLSSET